MIARTTTLAAVLGAGPGLCLGLVLGIVLGAAPGLVHADQVVTGVVVKTDAREIFVNLGAGKGVVEGAQLRIKRPITLRHPITRAPVVDWLPIGSATVTSAGSALTMAVLDSALRAQVAVGDIVEVYVERDDRPAPTAVEPAGPVDTRPLPTVEPETAELLHLWRSLTGASLDRRISAWEGWLATHGSSPHATAVTADLEALRAQREATTPRSPTAGASAVKLDHLGPSRAPAGRDLALVFVVDDPAALASASLHYRKVGGTTYQRTLLTREGGLYLRGAIPAAAVASPGVEYFVEAAGPGGDSGAAYASPERPHPVEVDPPPLVTVFDPAPGRVRLTIQTSYLDFATFDHREVDGRAVDRRDRFSLTEIDVLYRLRVPLWGVRAGFGSYGGSGGRADGVWTAASPAPTVGFQYGYVETELRTPGHGVPFGIATRLVVGVGNDGLGVGGAARVRIGDADGNNLSASLSGIDQLGFVSDLRLETWPRPRLPIGVSVGVTDQPGKGDLGVRLATDLGWQARSWVRPTLRVSWQGRTAAHAGLGGGLGLVFDW